MVFIYAIVFILAGMLPYWLANIWCSKDGVLRAIGISAVVSGFATLAISSGIASHFEIDLSRTNTVSFGVWLLSIPISLTAAVMGFGAGKRSGAEATTVTEIAKTALDKALPYLLGLLGLAVVFGMLAFMSSADRVRSCPPHCGQEPPPGYYQQTPKF